MRRFWLLLLAFVMPFQMSWAAVHFCDETPLAAMASADSAQEPQAESKAKAKAVAADACCVSAHGCHGLHSLMNQPEQAGFFPGNALVFLDSHARMRQRNFSVRHERPQWSAA